MSQPLHLPIILISSDGHPFEIAWDDRKTVEKSMLLKNLIQDHGPPEEPIPILKTSQSVLRKVLQFCEHHRYNEPPAEQWSVYSHSEVIDWDRDFVRVTPGMLIELFKAADYLDIPDLMLLCAKALAEMLNGKSAEEMRLMFNIPNDLTIAERQALREENDWDEVSGCPGETVARDSKGASLLRDDEVWDVTSSMENLGLSEG